MTTSFQKPPIDDSQKSTTSSFQIPFWFEDKSKWWVQGKLSDSEFKEDLQWLAWREQLSVKSTDVDSKISEQVRDYVRDWTNGQINDTTFLTKINTDLITGVIKIQAKTPSVGFTEYSYMESSPLFDVYAYKKDLVIENGIQTSTEVQLELKTNMTDMYDEIGVTHEKQNTVVIAPIFTSTAYDEPGFYTTYRGECDLKCLHKQIQYGKPYEYHGSAITIKTLKLLGYKIITDIDVDKNPNILSSYDKVIVLHNEYVTQKEFDAITNHEHVLYLYPNSLYALITVDYDNDSIALVRGHGYPNMEIANGFEWKFDNSKFEYDNECKNWRFYEIKNGKMLNCYPENILFKNEMILKAIKGY